MPRYKVIGCDLWSDDAGHEDYNLMVRAPYPYSHEVLRRADPLYDIVLITDWNWPRAVRGRGSAIFVHRWRRPGVPRFCGTTLAAGAKPLRSRQAELRPM